MTFRKTMEWLGFTRPQPSKTPQPFVQIPDKQGQPMPSPDDRVEPAHDPYAEPIFVGDRNHDDYGFDTPEKRKAEAERQKAKIQEEFGKHLESFTPEEKQKIKDELTAPHREAAKMAAFEEDAREKPVIAETAAEPVPMQVHFDIQVSPAKYGPGPDVEPTIHNVTSDRGYKMSREVWKRILKDRLGFHGAGLTNYDKVIEELVLGNLVDALFPMPIIKFKLFGAGAKLPTKDRASDAGIDFYTDIPEPVYINPGDGYTFTTGIKCEVPPGWAILLWDRSSLGSNLIFKGAGVLDCEYRGELMVTLANVGRYQRTFLPGDKIIQGILTKIHDCEIRNVDDHEEENGTLTETNRGTKGHGSSGR